VTSHTDTYDAALWKWLKASKALDPTAVHLPGVKLRAMKDESFHTQSAHVKIAILALLVRACLDSAAIRYDVCTRHTRHTAHTAHTTRTTHTAHDACTARHT
jgi:hypothetical protein